METINIVILSLSGLLLTFVGLLRLTNPKKTYLNNSGIQLENDVDLLNEIRGLSAVMLFGGLLTLLGTVVQKLTFTSFAIASLIFVGFAIGRLFSMGKDGKPNQKLKQGLIFEVIFGSLNIFGLINQLI